MLETPESQSFLACRLCCHAHRVLPLIPGDEEAEAERQAFLNRHLGHPVETVTRFGTALVSDRPLWDPLAATFIEVTNGQEVLVLRSDRSSMNEPRQRTLMRGRLRCRRVDVSLDRVSLVRGLDAQFFPHRCPARKVLRMLAVLDGLLAKTDADTFSLLFDLADDPGVTVAAIPPHVRAALIERCGEIFDPWEMAHVCTFVSRESSGDGLLTVRVTRAFDLVGE